MAGHTFPVNGDWERRTDMSYLLRGILIGLLFGIPVGAVGALTVQRTWSSGVKAGLLTGLGSSAADCFYACTGVFGLTLISDFLLRWQEAVTALGGAVVLVMGVKSLLRPRRALPSQKEQPGGIRLFLTSFSIGITNPAAIMTYLFAFSYFGISETRGLFNNVLLVAGVFFGTYFWWLSLSAATQTLKKRAAKIRLETMNRIFGGVLCIFGAVILLRLFI